MCSAARTFVMDTEMSYEVCPRTSSSLGVLGKPSKWATSRHHTHISYLTSKQEASYTYLLLDIQPGSIIHIYPTGNPTRRYHTHISYWTSKQEASYTYILLDIQPGGIIHIYSMYLCLCVCVPAWFKSSGVCYIYGCCTFLKWTECKLQKQLCCEAVRLWGTQIKTLGLHTL